MRWILCLVLAGLQTSSEAAEKWADSSPLPESLSLWLDASRQKAAYQAHGRKLVHGGTLDVWYDASGTGTDLSQRVANLQPRFFQAGEAGLVRFEGGQFLGRTGRMAGLDEFTLFLVAAPRSNPGSFSAWLAFSALGKNDYLTGLNLDQGPTSSDRLTWINAEGTGFVGARNLLNTSLSFNQLRLMRLEGTRKAIQLFIDGRQEGQRPRGNGTIAMDTITLAARYYSNTAQPAHVQGFYDGDIAEVLLFRRALTPDECKRVEALLQKKYATLAGQLAAGTTSPGGYLGRPIANPPPIQVLVPGFTVRELPVQLPNINNLRYRADGKLVALGYNGNIYLLADKDGDGLEESVEVFWENKTGMRGPIGMLLTPPGYKKGQGVFVASKGKVSLIVDTDGDDRADQEIIVAEGWKEIAQAVDALGVAMDKDGSLYFGLGTANYANAYLMTKDGRADYDIASDRGTIQKVSADFKKRATVCTGIRFPVALAFNRHGDLFCTDQEGATWLPNGNPFDELLHILPGRHYGFPPRHPRLLPKVIDEPSVFDYSPQHQSTCGLFFNEPVNGGPVFGPANWRGAALICGESRGKLFRTTLVKTPAGYVAQNHLLACLQMLTIDACVSPQGDLVVCCHSGPPDWGTGPQGKGKIFKISYTDRTVPQPLFAYAAGPCEVRIPFDRPLDPAYLKVLASKIKIEYGSYVRPGDRFETLQPPYAVVKRQLATPRFELPVQSVQVTGDRRTLMLTTAVQAKPVSYAITLPSLETGKTAGLPQHRTIDVGYDLTGVQADWLGKDGTTWSGWLPHVDLEVARILTANSAGHEPFWKMTRKPGQLTLRTNLDLWSMLRPAVQPGSTLDYEHPTEEVRLHVGCSDPVVVSSPLAKWTGRKTSESTHLQEARTRVKEHADWPLELQIAGQGMSALRVSFSTNEDERRRALPLRRILLPWVQQKPAEMIVQRELPQLQGGNWANGQVLFHGEKALCGRCHQVRGQGGLIGPDLSNLVHRDYDSVLRDIRLPSVALNPDYLAYAATMKDGRFLTGTLRSQGDKVWLGTTEGKEIPLARDGVEKLDPLAISIMPDGLDKKLTASELRDLMTFLLTQPLEPAPLERKDPPAPRTKKEVDAILKDIKMPKGPLAKVHIVLAAGPKDHGPGEHDYPLWQRRWLNLLSMAKNTQVSTAFGWPSPKQWESADLIVFYSANPAWTKDKGKDLDAFLERGGGLVYIHWAVEGRKDAEALAERIGLASRSGWLKYRHGPLELSFTGKHPITRGFDKVRFIDESYWNYVGDPAAVNVLATSAEDGKPQPQMWTVEKNKGRVFVNILGHYTWTFDDPLFRILLLRGMAWSARQPVERWVELATMGVRMDR